MRSTQVFEDLLSRIYEDTVLERILISGERKQLLIIPRNLRYVITRSGMILLNIFVTFSRKKYIESFVPRISSVDLTSSCGHGPAARSSGRGERKNISVTQTESNGLGVTSARLITVTILTFYAPVAVI
jgi:hypothetical protein